MQRGLAPGSSANAFRWASELDALGIAVLIVDSFGGRGVTETSSTSGLASEVLIVDACRALARSEQVPGVAMGPGLRAAPPRARCFRAYGASMTHLDRAFTAT